MAVPIRRFGESPVGALSIAGPSVRLTSERFHALAPMLSEAADEIARASVTAPLFASRRIVEGYEPGK